MINGIPSPDMKLTEKTTYPGVLVKEEMSKVWERHHNCCNGYENVSDNCECQTKNGEVGISIKKREHSEHQIKPGPTLSGDESDSSELDLDVDSVNNDTEEITSCVKSCNMTANTPTDTECELKQEFPLSSLTHSQDSATNTCNCVSNIIRNLSFAPVSTTTAIVGGKIACLSVRGSGQAAT